MTRGRRAAASPHAVLLDTHTLLWLVSTPEKVSRTARDVLAVDRHVGGGQADVIL